jgi:hypothetical protein
MPDFSLLDSKWDAKFACYFLQKFIDSRLLLNDNTAVGAIDHLKNLSKYFAQQIDNPNVSYFQLSLTDEEQLEQQWLKIVNYENCNLFPTTLHLVSRNISEIKVKNIFLSKPSL